MQFKIILLPFVLVSLGCCCGAVEDTSDLNACLPQLADRCFEDVTTNLQCHLNQKMAPDCRQRDLKDLCSSASDALKCASDIIDSDCSVTDGRNRFDEWMKGLNSVYNYLCITSNESLEVLVASNKCWNSLAFLSCVEKSTHVTHVVDLLTVILDKNECNWLLVAISTCNVRASIPSKSCYPPQDVIAELLLAFFTKTKCGSVCADNRAHISSAVSLLLLASFLASHFLSKCQFGGA